jgi:mono/diheme cytochrome c family protein
VTRHFLATILAIAALGAAAPPAAAAGPAGAGAGDLARGRVLFAKHCKVCHGEGGEGDGMLAAHLRDPPGDLTDPERMAGRSAEDLLAVVRDGGPARGLSSVMVGFGDRLTPQELADVVAFTRSLAPPVEDGE